MTNKVIHVTLTNTGFYEEADSSGRFYLNASGFLCEVTTAPPDGISVLTSDPTRSTLVTNENLVTMHICTYTQNDEKYNKFYKF